MRVKSKSCGTKCMASALNTCPPVFSVCGPTQAHGVFTCVRSEFIPQTVFRRCGEGGLQGGGFGAKGVQTDEDEGMALPWAPFCLSKWGMICCLDEGEEQELWHQVYGISLEHMSTGVFGLWPYAGAWRVHMCLVRICS